ncbi:hypothetical protein SAMN04490240_4111 [Rhodococcus pyridinivorans]|uniref:hypothetical protein n=1 Tax=Rhodococcus pyridinivorans TaxID=103816 RepID=UPI00089B34C4|nr:hypothetical protein [Rhodococcus pyridinivorans]SED52747.1 hypothetical protein SAMN04490240_4111 [Rhodococcus pyridinivorans]
MKLTVNSPNYSKHGAEILSVCKKAEDESGGVWRVVYVDGATDVLLGDAILVSA